MCSDRGHTANEAKGCGESPVRSAPAWRGALFSRKLVRASCVRFLSGLPSIKSSSSPCFVS